MKGSREQKKIRQPLVAVVDDDESVRESLPDLLKELGFTVLAFSSADEFLVSDWIDRITCLLLDIAMPGMSGLDLQKELKRRGYKIPIIFITARKDESTRVQVLEQGAVDILFKPFSDIALREALSKAMVES
ncbi:MAG: response regulator transcription factor [Candidatus Acidiferrales bacterium]